MNAKFTLSFGVIAILSACGGGGTSPGGGATRYATELADLQTSFAGPSGAGSIYFTPEPDLPEGTATYRGVATIDFGFTDDFDPIPEGGDLNDAIADLSDATANIEAYLGALTMSVDFAGGDLTGSVRNFERLQGGGVSGSLTISGGSLTTGQNTTEIGGAYTANATGSIAGDAHTFDVSGNFLGTSGNGMSVYFAGTGDTDGGGAGMAAR